MDFVRFMDKFYEDLQSAAEHWKLGEREFLIDLVYDAHVDGFNEGCNYVRKYVEEYVKSVKERGNKK